MSAAGKMAKYWVLFSIFLLKRLFVFITPSSKTWHIADSPKCRPTNPTNEQKEI